MKYAVYGTLRLNQGNYDWCLKNKKGVEHLETKTIQGYDMYSVGGFPGIIPGNGSIVVDIFEVNNLEVQKNLDGLEGYRSYDEENSMYLKRKTKDDEFIYIWNREVSNLVEILEGDWVEYKKQKTKQYV